jgi:hypothetical protein
LVLHLSHYIDLGENVEWKDEFLGGMFANMLGVGRGCCSSPESDLMHESMRRIGRAKAAQAVEQARQVVEQGVML